MQHNINKTNKLFVQFYHLPGFSNKTMKAGNVLCRAQTLIIFWHPCPVLFWIRPKDTYQITHERKTKSPYLAPQHPPHPQSVPRWSSLQLNAPEHIPPLALLWLLLKLELQQQTIVQCQWVCWSLLLKMSRLVQFSPLGTLCWIFYTHCIQS